MLVWVSDSMIVWCKLYNFRLKLLIYTYKYLLIDTGIWLYWLLRVSVENEVPISSHIWVFDDDQTTLKPLKKMEYIFMTILGLTESFKMMNRPDPTVTLSNGLFLGKYKR